MTIRTTAPSDEGAGFLRSKKTEGEILNFLSFHRKRSPFLVRGRQRKKRLLAVFFIFYIHIRTHFYHRVIFRRNPYNAKNPLAPIVEKTLQDFHSQAFLLFWLPFLFFSPQRRVLYQYIHSF